MAHLLLVRLVPVLLNLVKLLLSYSFIVLELAKPTSFIQVILQGIEVVKKMSLGAIELVGH